MIQIKRTTIYNLAEYSSHLKNLTTEDKSSRFGYAINDYAIDQLMLRMVYKYEDHQLWCAMQGEEIVGWGHLAKMTDDAWELALSVEQGHQRKGIGDRLIGEMLAWAKFHSANEVFMHCIEQNRVIQHLARKHKLTTRERSPGERTAAIELPELTFFENNTQLWKEQKELFQEFNDIKSRMTELWKKSILPK